MPTTDRARAHPARFPRRPRGVHTDVYLAAAVVIELDAMARAGDCTRGELVALLVAEGVGVLPLRRPTPTRAELAATLAAPAA